MADGIVEHQSESPDTADATHSWGWIQVVSALFLGILSSQIFQTLWLSVQGPAQGGKPTLGSALAGLAGVWVGLLGLPLWLSARKGKGSFKREFGISFVLPRDLVAGVIWGVASQLLLVWLVYLPVRILSPRTLDDVSKSAKELTALADGWGFALLAVALVVVAPLVEEIFFRGLLLKVANKSFGRNAAIVVSAVVFGFYHFSLIQAPALIAFGLVLGALAQRNGRLGENIVAHSAFNAVTVLTLYLAR